MSLESKLERDVLLAELSMVLHDGHDEDKTEDLNELLEDFEWDGEEDGVNIHLHVDVGDKIIVRDDGSILVMRKGTF